MVSRWLALVLLVTITANTNAQTQATPFARLKNSPEKFRAFALLNFIESRLALRTDYEGLYGDLRQLDWDVAEQLRQWIEDPPFEAEQRWVVRGACIDALRDVVTDKASAALLETLAGVADQRGSSTVKQRAVFALAQFGDTKRADKMAASYVKMTTDADANKRAHGWNRLANLYSKMRRHADTVKAYKKMFDIMTAKGSKYPPRTQTSLLYNYACAMARAGFHDAAFNQVEKALEYGAKFSSQLPKSLLQNDRDIAPLRKDKRFAPMLEKFFGNGKK